MYHNLWILLQQFLGKKIALKHEYYLIAYSITNINITMVYLIGNVIWWHIFLFNFFFVCVICFLWYFYSIVSYLLKYSCHHLIFTLLLSTEGTKKKSLFTCNFAIRDFDFRISNDMLLICIHSKILYLLIFVEKSWSLFYKNNNIMLNPH